MITVRMSLESGDASGLRVTEQIRPLPSKVQCRVTMAQQLCQKLDRSAALT